MATLKPGTRVAPINDEFLKLAFPPLESGEFVVCVHSGALRAPENRLTLVMSVADGVIAWVGAVDECMLQDLSESMPADPRLLLRSRLFVGERLWQVVSPGLLVSDDLARPLYTVYDGKRPWVVIGELVSGSLLAAPLNDAEGNPKWWAPRLEASQLAFRDSKPSQVELAHLWSLGRNPPQVGELSAGGEGVVSEGVSAYFG